MLSTPEIDADQKSGLGRTWPLEYTARATGISWQRYEKLEGELQKSDLPLIF